VLSFAPADPPAWADTAEMATMSDDSKRLSKELKKRGFAFVGPTTMYALMQACGLVNDHLADCWVRDEVQAEQDAALARLA
jgi:DNA-3-methyladenine glycosylase I